MAVPTHMRLVVRGKFDGTPETWSFSTKYSRDNESGIDASYGDLSESAITAAVDGLIATSMFSVGVVLEDWRAYIIGTDGKMEGNGPLLHEYTPGAVKGTSGGALKPPQCAVVVTTVAENRGPAKLGRFYLPVTQHALAADWRLSPADAALIATAATNFMKNVSNAIDLELTASAVGLNISGNPASSAPGVRQEITHVEVGRVFDTLRNRRKSLLEDRVVGGAIDW